VWVSWRIRCAFPPTRCLLDDKNEAIVNRALLNKVFKDASETTQKDLLIYTERQNVSVDMIGSQAAVTIEAHETDTKTGFIPGTGCEGSGDPCQDLRLV